MPNPKSDLTYFFQGLTMTLVILLALSTAIGLLVSLVLVIAPASLRDAFNEQLGGQFEVGLALGALVQAGLWLVLPRIGFVSDRASRRFSKGMLAIAVVALVLVLLALL